ncbi:MAG: hypothetical protein C4309_07175, partial [Chloroflexota bacterium]
LWAALECHLNNEGCRRGDCECGLESISPAWGAQRVVNLMASWHNQLLEVLGAMGMREVRRLRGERGRAMLATEMEERVFIPLTAISRQLSAVSTVFTAESAEHVEENVDPSLRSQR